MPMFRPLRLTVLGLFVALLFALGVSAVATPGARAQSVMTPSDWFVANGDDVQVHFYFFWSESCPHCREAHPFIDTLPDKYPWLVLHSHE
ncbi:MAG: hypothetical protein KDE20_28865, partial [Caldilineaceae bacterium]|nr:hypothetical protein [Caldilineaceae bacterium]